MFDIDVCIIVVAFLVFDADILHSFLLSLCSFDFAKDMNHWALLPYEMT